MEELDEMRALGAIVKYIPQEMYWAYEAVRRSGLYNMFCFHPLMNRYSCSDSNPDECLKVMDEIYVKFCAYNNVDISQPQYVHMTKDHVKLIQGIYGRLQEYYDPMPEGVVEIKKTVTTNISI